MNTLQRSKQQALAFLLGAILVGGALGFSAGRVMPRKAHAGGRQAMYDDLALSAAQRGAMDSLLDVRNCQMRAIMKPMRPQMDSMKKAGRDQMLRLLDATQRAKLEARLAEANTRNSRDKNNSSCKS
ncbi:MAG: hypothetical protein JWO05_2437 [Gemmatimonadetes bacterium]|nr:hypothetical protein [Gemmatimonadota bacterium]